MAELLGFDERPARALENALSVLAMIFSSIGKERLQRLQAGGFSIDSALLRSLLLNLKVQQLIAHAVNTVQADAAARHYAARHVFRVFAELHYFLGVARSIGIGDVVAGRLESGLRHTEGLRSYKKRCVQTSHGDHTWQDQVCSFNLASGASLI